MKKILIVEDDVDIAELEQDYLQLHGFAAAIADNGEDGLKAALTGEYELVILDVMLPGLDGFEVCRRLREASDIPILFVTARKEDIDKIRGLGRGADDYIVKPFSPGELVARVKAHLSRYERLSRKTIPAKEICIGRLRILTDEMRVLLDGQEIRMPNKEYELLCFLAMNPNKVFSKEELFDRLWGQQAIGDISTVTVHIKRLREKIATDNANQQYIETVWGAGYRLNKADI